MLLCISVQVFAHDFEAVNSDGKTICYNITSSTEPRTVAVTYEGEGSSYNDYLTRYTEVINIPSSVTYGGYTYNVTSIGNSAFSECSSLTEITCNANTTTSLNYLNPFSGVNTQIPVYIPYGSSMSYSSNWSYFSNFIEGDFEYSLSAQSNDTSMGNVTILTQPICSSPQAVINVVAKEGCRFDHWSDGTISNPYTFTLTQDTSISAYFAFQVYDTIIIRDTIETFVSVHDTITLYDTIENTDTIYITETPCARVSTYIYATINSGKIYSMNGFNEVSAGVYTHNFETYDGCDSTVTLILSVNSGLENISREITLKLYPNPTQDNVVLNLDGTEKDSRIFLTDVQGRRIREDTLKAKETSLRIDMQDLESGAYYLRIVSDNFQRTEKIIKK